MSSSLTLNDFRNVLGKVNDGNVVITHDEKSVEKVNYGGIFSRFLRLVKTTPDDAAQNKKIKEALCEAIENSAEGKTLSVDDRNRIYAALGIKMDDIVNNETREAAENAAFSVPLTRRDLKRVIEIIDDATGNDALIAANKEALKSRDLLYETVADAVESAMNEADCLKLPADSISRVEQMRRIFGNDFNGRSPAELEKFVRLNMAVIRDQVFDRLYWSRPLNGGEANLNERIVGEYIKGQDEPVTQKETEEAFVAVVGELMEKFAAGEPVRTRVENLLRVQDAVMPADEGAASIWNNILRGDANFLSVVDEVFTPRTEGISSFAREQLSLAATVVKNHMLATFNRLYVANNFNPQATDLAFREAISSFMNLLEACSKDIGRLELADADRLRENVAKSLAQEVETSGALALSSGLDNEKLGKFILAFRSVSTLGMVEQYVNAKYPYVEDKKSVIDFFMKKIDADPEKGGISKDQRKVLEDVLKASIDGPVPGNQRSLLESMLFDQVNGEYEAYSNAQNPEHVRQLRMQRNEKAFAGLVKIYEPENSRQLTDEQKLCHLKISALNCKLSPDDMLSHDAIGKLGIIGKDGSLRILTDKDGKPLAKAVDTLDAELVKLDDEELKFYSQYTAKNFHTVDRDLKFFCKIAKLEGDEYKAIFKNALIDGTISIESVPAKAVPLLKQLILAPVHALCVENSTNVIGLRDCLTRKDQTSSLAGKLFRRMQDRFEATGIKPGIPCLGPIDPSEKMPNAEAGRRLIPARRGDITQIRGFGTLDPARILRLFKEMNIDLAPLDGEDEDAKVDVIEKVHCLSLIAEMNGFNLDGLPEFTQRILGKSFADVTLTDVYKALNSRKLLDAGKQPPLKSSLVISNDPIAGFTGAKQKAQRLFAGTASLSETRLPADECRTLFLAARRLASAAPGTAESVTVAGESVELRSGAGGTLIVKIGGLPMRAAFGADALSRMIENEVASKPDAFDPDLVTDVLPEIEDVRSGAVPLVRARELYAKTAAAKTGTLVVMFSRYTTEELRDIALRAVKGQFTARDLKKDPPASYNSGAMIEMHENLSKTSSAEVDACVKIASPAPRPMDERRSFAPDDATVRNIVADIFLNKDTWAFDAGGGARPGERMRKLIAGHEPELNFIFGSLDENGDGMVRCLPEVLRGDAKAVLSAIRELVRKTGFDRLKQADALSGNDRAALAEIERKVGEAAGRLVDAMQARVTALFKPHAAAGKLDWQKTFAELNGKEGIDVDTRQGAFTMKVLQSYFKESAMVDKRAMLSAMIRNTDEKSTDAKLVAELLKGAGPLLQKMLQGLPLSSFDPDTQLALKDMKSRLLPIPDEAVKAQMLELVRSSKGSILSIEVKRSLGAASVGQAFLCTVRTKEHPRIGEECVVKLLRPNVDTAVMREKAMIDRIIGDDPAMKATFDGQYRKILEEFDLTLESTNVSIGEKIYERPRGWTHVHSMKMFGGAQSTMTSMILKKADGVTFDSYVDKIRDEAEDILSPLRRTTEVGGVKKTVYKADSAAQCVYARRRLMYRSALLKDRRNHLLKVARAWFDNALFGNGFFHGDLHGGNLMTGATGTTFIDFGNCSRLSAEDQKAMKMMFAAVVSGDVDHVVANFRLLMTKEAAAAFDARFPAGSEGYGRLEAILRRGTALDLMSRVQAFLSAVQGADVAVPAPLQNFVQSYVRLCDIVADIDRAVEDIEVAAKAVFHDIPGADEVKGESKVVSYVKKLVRAYVGNADTPFSHTALSEVVAEFDAYADSDEGRREIKSLSSEPERIWKELFPLDNLLHESVCCSTDRGEPTERGASTSARGASSSKLGDLLDSFKELEKNGRIKLQDDGKTGVVAPRKSEPGKEKPKAGKEVPEKKDTLFADIEDALMSCVRKLSGLFGEQLRTEDSGGESHFGVAVMEEKSVTDVCMDVISGHQDDLKNSAIAEYGMLGVFGFVGRLKKECDEGEKAANRMKNVGDVLFDENRRRKEERRLTGQEMNAISRATSTFLVPQPRPDADKNWGASAAKRQLMLDVIEYNLSRVKPAGDGALSDSAVAHAALNMGLVDGQLVTSIAGLPDKDYNQLLAEALQRGKGLPTAISSLRGAKGLLDEISIIPEE